MRSTALALLPLAASLAAPRDLRCARECADSLFSDFQLSDPIASASLSRECWICLGDPTAGIFHGQIPASATTDLLRFKLGVGYTEGWCSAGTPSGWEPDGEGGFTGCEVKHDFPGLNSTSHMSHAYVKAEMAKLPRLQYEGKAWRGNELGFIISNELFWPRVSPRTASLGSTPSQHMVMRPIVERVFGKCDATCTSALQTSARDWAAAQDSISVQEDVTAWVHTELVARAFPNRALPVPAADFVALQSSIVTLSTLTQLLSDDVTQLVAGDTFSKLSATFDAYRPLVEEVYGDELRDADCAPTTDCVDLATSHLLDLLFFAGGLSVPSGLSTGLWVLHGDTAPYGEAFPAPGSLRARDDPGAFFYESIRFFAPVVGLPWWTTPPARAEDDAASQYNTAAGVAGVRTILNLALANKDPNVWGEDGHLFRVRPHAEYASHFVGFADFALDDDVAGGKMNRACPAKSLALAMGKAFFTAWEQEEWCTKDSPGYTEATPFVDPFTLVRGVVEGRRCSPRWPWEESECCRGTCRPEIIIQGLPYVEWACRA